MEAQRVPHRFSPLVGEMAGRPEGVERTRYSRQSVAGNPQELGIERAQELLGESRAHAEIVRAVA
jgi:hypothetical protein